MSILERLEKVRISEKINKGQFEKMLGKSNGYLKILKDKGGLPGADLFIQFSENFREYDLNWLMTGEGKMKKAEGRNDIIVNDEQEENEVEKRTTLLDVRDDLKADINDIKRDLHALAEGGTKNAEVMSSGIYQALKDLQKLVRFVEKIDPVKIKKASEGLERFLIQHK